MVLENLQYVSIVIETIIAIMGLILVFKKNKNYGYGIFLTFAIYVFYDYAKLASLSVSTNVLYSMFFIASLSALWAVWRMYKENNRKR
ncbi:MAG: hypothetical protein WC979_04130 [Candidatus Pacearchaeota archaeon]|jgi:uncharacterized membrane protein